MINPSFAFTVLDPSGKPIASLTRAQLCDWARQGLLTRDTMVLLATNEVVRAGQLGLEAELRGGRSIGSPGNGLARHRLAIVAWVLFALSMIVSEGPSVYIALATNPGAGATNIHQASGPEPTPYDVYATAIDKKISAERATETRIVGMTGLVLWTSSICVALFALWRGGSRCAAASCIVAGLLILWYGVANRESKVKSYQFFTPSFITYQPRHFNVCFRLINAGSGEALFR